MMATGIAIKAREYDVDYNLLIKNVSNIILK